MRQIDILLNFRNRKIFIRKYFDDKGVEKMITRINKNKNYTIMSNNHLREKDMSLKAKGMLSLVFSLPENWKYSLNGLCALSKDNITSVKSCLEELKEFGYLRVTKLLPNETQSATIEYVYDFTETPFEFPEVESLKFRESTDEGQGYQHEDNQGIENLSLENPPLYKYTTLSNKEDKIKNNNKPVDTGHLNSPSGKKNGKQSIQNIILQFCEKNILGESTVQLLNDWLEVRKAKHAPNTERAVQVNLDKLLELSAQSRMSVDNFIEETIRRGWQAFYPIKQPSVEDVNMRIIREEMEKCDQSRNGETDFDFGVEF